MKTVRPSFRRTCRNLVFTLLATALVAGLRAEDAPTKFTPGSQLDALTVGATTYRQVQIRSITARSAMITFDGGMKSILLRDLTPELQQRFSYSPEAERASEAAAKVGQANAEKQQQARLEALRKNRAASRNATQAGGKLDQLLRSFGQPPDIAEEVDLRPRFSELGLWVKDQGHRPSCAVFAIVSALEFQSAEANNTPQRFSEEYLNWATKKSLNRLSVSDETTATGNSGEDQSDDGFKLQEVATALRTYGIPLRDEMPNGLSKKNLGVPTDEIIQAAQRSKRTVVHTIPGHNGATLVNHVIQALNLGIPVPVGMVWPDTRVWRVQFLNGQRTTMNNGHAVTMVGYRCKTGRIEDAVFVFKNSWGPHWGQGGYGTASYDYLAKNLHSAVVLEVPTEVR